MKVIDCFWEEENIGSRVREIDIDPEDTLESSPLPSEDESYDMTVYKCPVNKIDYNIEISKAGAFFVESQFELSKTYRSFDFEDRFLARLMKDIEFRDIESEEEMTDLLERIDDRMFSTDRVSLDPALGPVLGARRYRNWIRTSFLKGSASLFSIVYKGDYVGFVMYKIEEGVWDGMLGGIFDGNANPGLGILTPSALFLYARERSLPMLSVKTAVSSNNLPVLRLYEHFGFSIPAIKYVFVKHSR